MSEKSGNKPLTDKQEKFVQELIKGKSQREAYKAAYNTERMTDEVIDVKACELFANGKVAVRYNSLKGRLVKESENECIVSAKQIIAELAKIAFSDGSDFAEVLTKKGTTTKINEDGEAEEQEIEYKVVDIKETKSLTADKRAAISCIKETKFGIAVESHDKVKALELLGKHLGIFTDKIDANIKGSVGVVIKDDIE